MAESHWVDVPDDSSSDTTKTSKPKSITEMISSFIKGTTDKTEKEISSRPSAIASLLKDPVTMQSLMQHPFKTPLRAISGAWEGLEGVPSDIMLNSMKMSPLLNALTGGSLPNPNLQKMASDIGKTMSGQRPAEIGDVLTSVGTPKPIAAIGGLLATSLIGTPTAALGELTMGPVVKTAKYLGELAKKTSMPAVTKIIKFMSGIPEKHTEFAINNPDLLQAKKLEAFRKECSALMEDHVLPLENDRNVKVDLKPTHEELKNLCLQTGAGDLTTQAAKLTDKEQIFIHDKILTELQGYTGNNQPTFSRVRYLLARMDDVLSSTYKQRMKGVDAVSDSFQKIVGKIRHALRSSINQENFPEADKALTQWSKYETAKNVAKSFSNMNPSFLKSLPIRLAAVIALGVKSPVAGLMALPLTMPLVYKGMIGGADLGQKAISEPTVTLEMLKKMGLGEQGQQNTEEDWQDVK